MRRGPHPSEWVYQAVGKSHRRIPGHRVTGCGIEVDDISPTPAYRADVDPCLDEECYGRPDDLMVVADAASGPLCMADVDYYVSRVVQRSHR